MNGAKQITQLQTSEISMTAHNKFNELRVMPLRESIQLLTSAPFALGNRCSSPNGIFPVLATGLLTNPRCDKLGACLNFDRWKCKAEQKNCDEECQVPVNFVPGLLTTFRNYVFSVNESEVKENLFIFDITSVGKIELKNTFKLGVPCVRDIAASLEYFALAYSNLKR